MQVERQRSTLIPFAVVARASERGMDRKAAACTITPDVRYIFKSRFEVTLALRFFGKPGREAFVQLLGDAWDQIIDQHVFVRRLQSLRLVTLVMH
ncbi:MAG: hypothetical protein ROO70_02890 [Labrenzia sp.]